MSLKVPYSMPPKKQTQKTKINEDEFEAIVSTLYDEDIGVEGGKIDEAEELQAAKERASHKESIDTDVESTLFDEARDRTIDGNDNYDIKTYTLSFGEDLRDASLKAYGNADGWILLAAANDITNPSSDQEVYEGRTLIVI